MLIGFFENKRIRVAIIVLAWTVWVLARLGETLLNPNNDASWSSLTITIALVGLGWAIATPFILYITEKVRKVQNALVALLLHIVAGTAVLIFRIAFNTALVLLIFGENEHPFAKGDASQLTQFFFVGWAFGNFIHYGLIVSAYNALIWFKEYKESEDARSKLLLKSETLERQLSESRLTALRMQLNPHFLFNTLHSVATLVRLKEREKAITVLSLLSSMLRYTVYDGSKNMVTVGEEIDFIKGYLSIEEIRFQDRLRVDWNIEAETMEGMIPNLLLQPLVENSIKHGLKHSEEGVLSIHLKRTDQSLIINIHDNGVGLPAGWSVDSCKGIGLRNTIARLENIYNGKHQIKITSNSGMQGTQVKIVIPFTKNNNLNGEL